MIMLDVLTIFPALDGMPQTEKLVHFSVDGAPSSFEWLECKVLAVADEYTASEPTITARGGTNELLGASANSGLFDRSNTYKFEVNDGEVYIFAQNREVI